MNSKCRELIKTKRKEFDSVSDFVYKIFEKTEYFKENEEEFGKHASEIVDDLRQRSWKKYLSEEKKLKLDVYSELIDVKEDMTPTEAVKHFLEKNLNNIYDINLSITQSRRSRTGKEFEAIVELVLLWAGIPVDCQANIGLGEFKKKGLFKQCDMVFPSLYEYTVISKDKGAFISLKTSLRERHAEVADEKTVTMAQKIYLVTMDGKLSEDVLKALKEKDIYCVTTKSTKEKMLSQIDDSIEKKNLLIKGKKEEIKEIEEKLETSDDDDLTDRLEQKLEKIIKQVKSNEERIERLNSKKRLVNRNVYDFEYLIGECKKNMEYWNHELVSYTLEDKEGIAATLNIQMDKHLGHTEVYKRYADRLLKLKMEE